MPVLQLLQTVLSFLCAHVVQFAMLHWYKHLVPNQPVLHCGQVPVNESQSSGPFLHLSLHLIQRSLLESQ